MQVSLNPSINYYNYRSQSNTCFGMYKRQATKFRELVEKSYDAKRALDIVNMAENSVNLHMQKAAQSKRV